MPISEYNDAMARAAAASDVFNAIGETHRREILDALVMGERPVGELVDALRLTQPQVSKHLRVLSDVGLVKCRAEGRRRLYRLDHECLRPVHDWMEKYEQAWNRRLDRLDDYLTDLQRKERRQ
jgi:DNA-binding transcriptional ArsR family regulator